MGAVTLSVSLLLHLGLHLGNHLLHSSKLWNTKHCHVEQKCLHSNMQTRHLDHQAQVSVISYLSLLLLQDHILVHFLRLWSLPASMKKLVIFML